MESKMEQNKPMSDEDQEKQQVSKLEDFIDTLFALLVVALFAAPILWLIWFVITHCEPGGTLVIHPL